ncbi:hypothetical protein ACFQZE_02810 [Paenibacillus sp. GCM10027627]|uniref:hypothetical protein n=1 Tax=unclassified Paenibacillus TaxID=185978 RepID=UPI00362B1461
MNLSDMLSYADIGQLCKIAGVYRCECNGNSKNELIQSILSQVSRHDVFEEQISGMKIEDIRFLNTLLFESRPSYSMEDLVARVQQSRFGEEAKEPEAEKAVKKGKKKAVVPPSPPSPRDIIIRFKHQGWLFNGYTGPGRYLFQVPNDLKARFRETLQRKFAEQLQYTDEPPIYRDEQGLILEDAKQLLYYVAQNEVQLTNDGSMYKRFLGQLMDRMGISEEMPAKGTWRFGYGRHFHYYPDRLSLLYDYMRQAKYIAEDNEALTVTDTGAEWIKKPLASEVDKLFRFWLKLYKTPVPNLLSLVHWIHALSEEWVTVESVKRVLLPLTKSFYYDDANAILEKRVMKMMMHMGLLRIGEHPVYGTVIRMTKAGNAVVSGNGLSLDGQSAVRH